MLFINRGSPKYGVDAPVEMRLAEELHVVSVEPSELVIVHSVVVLDGRPVSQAGPRGATSRLMK